MIYVPNYKPNIYPCVIVQSNGVLRAYRQLPRNNSTIDYVDYYTTSDYMYKEGTQNFGNSTTLPVCILPSDLTDIVYYRVDFVNVLIMFTILSIFLFYLPSKLIMRLFIRR